jgi:4a-hydroxytetrahydrobiopterin dehydratase
LERSGSSGLFGISASPYAFVERAAALAETEGHHREIMFGCGCATISTHTKKIEGLHESDFIMAAKLESDRGRARNSA